MLRCSMKGGGAPLDTADYTSGKPAVRVLGTVRVVVLSSMRCVLRGSFSLTSRLHFTLIGIPGKVFFKSLLNRP